MLDQAHCLVEVSPFITTRISVVTGEVKCLLEIHTLTFSSSTFLHLPMHANNRVAQDLPCTNPCWFLYNRLLGFIMASCTSLYQFTDNCAVVRHTWR